MLRRFLLWLPICASLACGRTGTRTGAKADAGSDLQQDSALPADLANRDSVLADWVRADLASPDMPAPDLVLPDLPFKDTREPDGQASERPINRLWPCSQLQPLADKGILTNRRSRQVVYARDRTALMLTVQAEAPAGIGRPDQLVFVDLFTGQESLISQAGGKAEPLGQSDFLLSNIGTEGTDLGVYSPAEGNIRIVGNSVCDHAATVDGSRVYLVHDCITGGVGSLDVVDISSGTSSPLAKNVVNGSLALSPAGRWIAFVVRAGDGSSGNDTIQVTDAHGSGPYALASQPGAHGLSFVSEEQLLFARGTDYPIYSGGELRVHVPGTGDASTAIASARDTGMFGYEVSPDKTWLLGAAAGQGDGGVFLSARLFAIHLDGSGETLLTKDLLPYWMYAVAIRAFVFSSVSARAVFQTGSDRSLWAVDLPDLSTYKLSDSGSFKLSPVTAEIAIVESSGDARQNRLLLIGTQDTDEILPFVSEGTMGDLQFLPDGRGMVFTEILPSGQRRLRYISLSHPEAPVLAEWTSSILSYSTGKYGEALGAYPIDPTSCYTVVDTDLAPGPGTRLILLPE
jgi:hypothetical protein